MIGLLELDADAALIIAAIRQAGGSEQPAVHVVTLGELASGFRRAAEVFGTDSEQAAARRRTLDTVAGAGQRRGRFSTFGIETATWQRFGEIRGSLGRRVSQNDTWITASALVNDRVLVTQDDTLAERAATVTGVRVAHVPRQTL